MSFVVENVQKTLYLRRNWLFMRLKSLDILRGLDLWFLLIDVTP